MLSTTSLKKPAPNSYSPALLKCQIFSTKTLFICTFIAIGLTTVAKSAIYFDFTGTGATGDATLHITKPITFDITSEVIGSSISFVIVGASPSAPASTWVDAAGLTYSVNGGVNHVLDQWVDAAYDVDAFSSTDSFVWGTKGEAIPLGSTVTLNSGTHTITGINSDFDLPTSGEYEIFIGELMVGTQFSNYGVEVVPEPSSIALLSLGGFSLFLRRRRK